MKNDTYGEISHAELADLRLHAQKCMDCGMLATVDPAFHATRYAHAPRVNHGGGIIFRWDGSRHAWIQEDRIVLGNGMAAIVTDPKCRNRGFCRPSDCQCKGA